MNLANMGKTLLIALASAGVLCESGCRTTAASGKTDGVDWVQFRDRKVELTADQAVCVVRSSLELMAKQMGSDPSKKGCKYVIERVDQTGFAIKGEIERHVGAMTLQAVIPSIDVGFAQFTGLGIKKSRSGKETAVSLMVGKEVSWDLPFANALDRDRLLSALAVLCEHLSMK